MSVSKKDCVFYAKVVKGYIPKVSFDAIATNIGRIPINVTANGMIIRVADRDEAKSAHSMWDIEWERKQFTFFKCSESMSFTLNAKHLQKMLKNVKKKDLLIFFIKREEKNRSMMGISIQPTGSQGDHAAKMETIYISINHVDIILPMLPDKDAYSHPMVVGSTDFQKIKKMSGVSKTTINVVMQKSNYIAFKSGDKKVLTNELEYGELSMNPDDNSGSNSSEDEESNSSKESDSESNSDDSEDYLLKYPSIYNQDFDMNLFAPLIKLPGLCTQMEFYVPLMNNFPLKISMSASSGLGRITYYIKDKRQIGAIETQKK